MQEEQDFIDRIIEGFQSLKDRPAYRTLAGQFAAGELTFIVDRQGIRIHLDQVELDHPDMDLGPEPGSL